MRKICIFGMAVAASATLSQPLHAGSRGSGHSFASAPRFSPSVSHFSGPSRSFSRNNSRFNAPAHFSSNPSFQNRSFTRTGPRFSPSTALQNRTTAFNSANFAAARTRFAANRTAGARTQAFNNSGRIIARHSANWHRNWDRHRDHFWHGHRCHFHNNTWVIFDPFFFYPYGYGYSFGYPYGAYYDNAAYNDSYAANEYSEEPSANQTESQGDARVSDVQSALAREGYYDGAIDGSLGPATRKALRRYQADHRLDVTGDVNGAVIKALRLR